MNIFGRGYKVKTKQCVWYREKIKMEKKPEVSLNMATTQFAF